MASDGTRIAGFDALKCALRCAAFVAPLPANTLVTGLATYEPGRHLYIADSANGLTRLRVPGCPPSAGEKRCVVSGLTTGHVIAERG